jgi:transposase
MSKNTGAAGVVLRLGLFDGLEDQNLFDGLFEDETQCQEVVGAGKGFTALPLARCLLERFQDCKTDILRFATDWRVPYTNNAAEQAIRFARVKEKVCAAMMLSPRILVAP